MKRILPLMLVLALCLGMFVGCGDQKSEATSAALSKTEAETTSTPEEKPAQEPPASVEAEDSAENAETVAEPVVYDLPLTDTPAEFSIFSTAAPGFMSPYIGTDGSYNTAESTRNFAERTGVTIRYIENDMFAFSENYNLMIASGDYPDLLGADGYAGGYTKALDDDVIIDLTDYVKNDMPAYCQRLDEAGVWQDVMNDEGRILAISSLNSQAIVDRGPVARGDWMEELNLEEPETYDELTELGKAMKNHYNLDYAFFVGATVNPSVTFSAGFDVPAFDATSSGSHFYQENGEVKSALVSDGFKDYLKLLNQWYTEGLISKDFFSVTNMMEVKDAFAGDKCAVCWDNADFITEDNRDAELAAKGFHAVAIPVTVQEPGQTLHYSLGMDNIVQGSICISTACEDPELLVKTLDFCFTDAGALLCNYGIEGVSYELDGQGAPKWTEEMTTAEDKTFRAAIVNFIMSDLPSYMDVTRYWSETFDEDSYHALELWGGADTDRAWDMPTALYFTTDESTAYSVTVTDVETRANEYILAAITGSSDIDATWDAYVDEIWSLGLQECIDAKQGAYDRYLNRETA